jgi:predicted nucleic acid-binding protein
VICYIDTSFLLSALLGQHPRLDHDAIWNDAEERVSSHIIRIETQVSVRRAGGGLSGGAAAWSEATMRRLRSYLDAITCKYLDDAIEEIIASRDELSRCRTLDAIHLATALFFQDHLPEPLGVCTLDGRMRATARDIGLTLIPETM